MRKPTTTCCVCGKPVYKRPNELQKYKNAYCDKECYRKDRSLPETTCKQCGRTFQPWNRRSKYCGKICTNKAQKGIPHNRKYEFAGRSQNERRLNELKTKFNLTSCMVKGCNYNKTYDVHRLIPGKQGGQYIVGNMFAVCPNHHAESHRKLIEFIKISDCELEVMAM